MQGLRQRLRRGEQAAGQDGLQHRAAPHRRLPGKVKLDEAMFQFPRNGRDDIQGMSAAASAGRTTTRPPLTPNVGGIQDLPQYNADHHQLDKRQQAILSRI